MKFKTIDDFDLKGKRVLLRSDLNSEVVNGKVLMNERIEESSRTIAELKKKGVRVVILAHQSQPGKKDFISLKQHAQLLSKFTKVKFVNDIFGKKAVSQIENLKTGEALLLENVRFAKEEFEAGGNRMTETLSKICDIYLNDSFSVCHRAQSSIVGFADKMPSGVGRLMEKELGGLEKLSKIKNALYLLGGSKEDNLLLINKKNVVTCGVFGQLCLIAKGYDLGAQNKFLADRADVIKKLKKAGLRVKTPVDLAVSANGKRKELWLQEFPSKYEIFDIGTETMESYKELIRKADAIFMKGTAGYCENNAFSKGTFELLKEISKSKKFSVLGGGSLSSAIEKARINKKKFGHISLSGGALVWSLAGKKLPGLEVLKEK